MQVQTIHEADKIPIQVVKSPTCVLLWWFLELGAPNVPFESRGCQQNIATNVE